jgi:alkylation response protein AidB-like acyl-CoA dehydrogenase
MKGGQMLPALSDEQVELGRVARSFFTARSPEIEVRRLAVDMVGYDRAVWAAMAEQIGIQGMAIPEAYGGSGYSLVEIGLVLQESGRSLLCAPLLPTVLAAACLLRLPDGDAHRDLLPAIANGQVRATIAVPHVIGAAPSITAGRTGGSWRLTGVAEQVLNGSQAELVLVVARTDRGPALFAIIGLDQVEVTVLSGLDPTRRLATLVFAETEARIIGTPDDLSQQVGGFTDLAAAMMAAESVGGAVRCLELGVEYAKVREQFGVPIGSFQAIKHKCADVLLAVEAARAAAENALWAVAGDSPDATECASLAKAHCTDAYFYAAAECLQIHGGIGFTWEHPAHLYLKRAKSSQILFGSPGQHRERMATAAGIFTSPPSVNIGVDRWGSSQASWTGR